MDCNYTHRDQLRDKLFSPHILYARNFIQNNLEYNRPNIHWKYNRMVIPGVKWIHFNNNNTIKSRNGGFLFIYKLYLLIGKYSRINYLIELDAIRNYEILRYLIEHGADINKEVRNNKTSLLYDEHLVGYGTDVNKEIDYYEIPLFNICLNGNKNIGKYLIELDNIVKFLIQYGADIHKENQNKETVLFNNDVEINKENREGQYTISENKNIVKHLIELGVDIQKRNCNGKTPISHTYNEVNIPLFYACQFYLKKMRKYLIEPYVDFDTINIIKDLEYCKSMKTHIIECGVDISKVNFNYITSLINNMESRNEIKYLVKHGSNINSYNKKNRTLLDYIPEFENCKDIEKYLIECIIK
ncbi:ankyrin repeat-containing domain protein [Neocallimastix sp. 'constans']